MVTFSDCKINLGLYITGVRPDGYHDIETVMLHVPWHDIIEVVPAPAGCDTSLTVIGRHVDCPPERNLVMKAYRALVAHVGHPLPPVQIILKKIIPDGAGLGGGSANATYTLRLLNQYYSLGLDSAHIAAIAAHIGADCAFFAYDRPMLARGIGDILEPVDVDLSGLTLLVAKPSGVSISTAEAYAGITTATPSMPLSQAILRPVDEWQGIISNGFEASVFAKAPVVKRYKDLMIDNGAIYSAMSGSGAAVFGLFPSAKAATEVKTLLPHHDGVFSCAL